MNFPSPQKPKQRWKLYIDTLPRRPVGMVWGWTFISSNPDVSKYLFNACLVFAQIGVRKDRYRKSITKFIHISILIIIYISIPKYIDIDIDTSIFINASIQILSKNRYRYLMMYRYQCLSKNQNRYLWILRYQCLPNRYAYSSRNWYWYMDLNIYW
jgi:hypothetical protein